MIFADNSFMSTKKKNFIANFDRILQTSHMCGMKVAYRISAKFVSKRRFM